MIVATALWLQAAVVPPVQDDGLAEDIVVTGKRDAERFRLRPLRSPVAQGPALPKAEVRLFGNAALAAESEKGEGPAQANRAMVRFKLKF